MIRHIFIALLFTTGVLCSPLMALSIVDSQTTAQQVRISFDEPWAQQNGEINGFEVADKRYGRFIPATATANGKHVILRYESYATETEQQQYVIWRYKHPNKQPLQSYTGDVPFKAVPLGKYPAVGQVRIACVGDSITHGFGIPDTQKRYPETLGRMLGQRFLVGRFGNSGKTAGKCNPGQWYGEQKEFTQALAFQADIYICNLGINDTGHHLWNPTASERDFGTLIEAFQGKQGSSVVLWGKLGPDFRGEPGKPGYPGNVFEGYSFRPYDSGSFANRAIMECIIAKLAKKYNCGTIDAYTEMAKDPELYKVDGLHPTPEGAAKLAELTYEWLLQYYEKK